MRHPFNPNRIIFYIALLGFAVGQSQATAGTETSSAPNAEKIAAAPNSDKALTGIASADVAPSRLWGAFHHQLEAASLATASIDDRRFEAVVELPEANVSMDVDWDEATGGARLRWRAPSPEAARAATSFAAAVATRSNAEPRHNHLCRGDHADDFPEPSLEGPPTCRGGTGQFSSALLELEKCGDYESALRILSACSKEKHAGGLIRLAWFYENGLGVPQRPERMTEYLRQAASSSTPGYPELAKVQYATALYFGIGTPQDRTLALRLFRDLAAAGNQDAKDFVQNGYHTAWRRQDGSVFRDEEWGHQER